MSEPIYLVQTSDRKLHAYFTREVLLIDLLQNRDEPVTLYKIQRGIGKVLYVPCSEAEIRGEAA